MLTLKIRYNTEEESKSKIFNYIKNYNSVFNCLFNYLQKQENSPNLNDLYKFANSLNNVFVDSYFRRGALSDAKQTFERFGKQKIIFGSKKLFFDRMKNLISREEFQIKKLRPLQIVGASHNNGNCKFQIISDSEILFKATKHDHFTLNLQNIGKNYRKYLQALILCQENKEIPITYKLDTEFVYITFDDNAVIPKIKNFKQTKKLENRVFAIDLNPNYIGTTITDWKVDENGETLVDPTIIKAEVYSLKDLNDYENLLNVSSDSPKKKYVTNKRNYETIQLAYKLIKLANQYKCKIFVVEDLSIKSSDKCKGRKFNRLVNNQWNRNLLLRIIEKNCKYFEIHFQKVIANYSSIAGNLVYRKFNLPDMCLASIELTRRGFEFYKQYISKEKPQSKNIIFDKFSKIEDLISKSLEEFGIQEKFENLQKVWGEIKKRKCNIRFSLEKAIELASPKFFSKNYKKAYLAFYCFV